MIYLPVLQRSDLLRIEKLKKKPSNSLRQSAGLFLRKCSLNNERLFSLCLQVLSLMHVISPAKFQIWNAKVQKRLN